MQTTGFEPVQTPAWQVSVCVQALPSLQAVPSAAGGFEQIGRASCRERAKISGVAVSLKKKIEAVQETGWPGAVGVHALPALQSGPSVAGGFEQKPVAGSHVPAAWP